MNKKQLIQVAKAGFPDRIKKYIDFNNVEIHHKSGIYRLFKKNTEFNFMLPKDYYLAIHLGEEKFVQFTTGNKSFNHYSAIKELEKLGLV